MTGRVLHTAEYFPAPRPAAGRRSAQVFHSSIDGGVESMHLMYLLSIAAASRSIHLSMSCFAPDDVALNALIATARRGVKFQLILPGPHNDTRVVQWASRAKWGKLLKAGAEIHQYQPTMFHCKVLVVDGLWTSVGSTNFDNRSFRLNDEANLNIYDRDVAACQVAIFNNDPRQSRRVTYEEWASRPWIEKLRERGAALLNAQLLGGSGVEDVGRFSRAMQRTIGRPPHELLGGPLCHLAQEGTSPNPICCHGERLLFQPVARGTPGQLPIRGVPERNTIETG